VPNETLVWASPKCGVSDSTYKKIEWLQLAQYGDN
jgi:hypothetical protein